MTRSTSVRGSASSSGFGPRGLVKGARGGTGSPRHGRKRRGSGWRRSEGSHDRQPAKDRAASADAPRARQKCVPLSPRSSVCAVKPTPTPRSVPKPHAPTGSRSIRWCSLQDVGCQSSERTHLSCPRRVERLGEARIAQLGKPITLDGGVCIESGDTGARHLPRSDSNRYQEAAAYDSPQGRRLFSNARWSGFTRVVVLNRRRRARVLAERCAPILLRKQESGRPGSRD